MCVYTGIFDVLENENDLAVVLGHEIAHVMARHGMEKLSKVVVWEFFQLLLTSVTGLAIPPGLPVVLVALPNSRQCETEADYLGLRLMARAGYDPLQAYKVWERMAEESPRLPNFMNTHPDPLGRAEKLREWAPKVLEEANEYRRQKALRAAKPARY